MSSEKWCQQDIFVTIKIPNPNSKQREVVQKGVKKFLKCNSLSFTKYTWNKYLEIL